MFCNQCGEENRNDRKFCSNCGSALQDYTKVVQEKDLLMPSDLIEKDRQQKKQKRKMLFCSIMSFVCLVVACVCIFVSSFAVQDKVVKLILSSCAVVLSIIALLLTVVSRKNSRKGQ